MTSGAQERSLAGAPRVVNNSTANRGHGEKDLVIQWPACVNAVARECSARAAHIECIASTKFVGPARKAAQRAHRVTRQPSSSSEGWQQGAPARRSALSTVPPTPRGRPLALQATSLKQTIECRARQLPRLAAQSICTF
jgi:hypothetical protein